jgi:hypothetical protein
MNDKKYSPFNSVTPLCNSVLQFITPRTTEKSQSSTELKTSGIPKE